jgi:hypothetical protein
MNSERNRISADIAGDGEGEKHLVTMKRDENSA